MVDPASEILLEMVESKNVVVDEAPLERFHYQKLQVAHAQHCNGALPADPDITLRLWSHLDQGVAEEAACFCPVEFSPDGDYSKGLTHARSNEFFGLRVQYDVVERLRIAIEHCRHHAVASCCD